MKYSITYDIVTPESAKVGGFAGSGFIVEDEPCTPEEAAEIYADHSFDYGDGFSFYDADASINYMTGEETMEAVHFSGTNKEMTEFWKIIGWD